MMMVVVMMMMVMMVMKYEIRYGVTVKRYVLYSMTCLNAIYRTFIQYAKCRTAIQYGVPQHGVPQVPQPCYMSETNVYRIYCIAVRHVAYFVEVRYMALRYAIIYSTYRFEVTPYLIRKKIYRI